MPTLGISGQMWQAVLMSIFRANFSGEPRPFNATNTKETPSLGQLHSDVEATDAWYKNHVSTLPESALSETLAFTFTDCDTGRMSIDVLFIHSAGPQSGEQGSAPFAKHLRESLGSAFRVTFAAMPAPTKPSYERWKGKLDELLPGGESPPILVGHSLGGSVLLKYISEHKPKITAAGLFVVATPYWSSADRKVKEFALRESFARSLPSSLKIYLYQSRDDEELGMEHLSRYSKAIPQATVRILDAGGHTFKDGLPELAEDIRALASQ